MAITSIGYDGTVDEVAWTKLQRAAASVYGVATATSWRVTAVTGADRTISIAPGAGWGRHVYDESDTNYTLQGGAVASGSRWDLVVLRRDWGPVGGGSSTFRIVPGTSTRQLPSRETNPGVLDDQPIALIQFVAGQTQPAAIIDLRCWAANSGLEAAHDLALGYLNQPGTTVKIGNGILRFELQGNGIWGWSEQILPSRSGLTGSAGWGVIGDVERQDLERGGAARFDVALHLSRLGGPMSVASTRGFTRLTGAILPPSYRPPRPIDIPVSIVSSAQTWGGTGILRFETGGQVSYMPQSPSTQTIGTGAYLNAGAPWYVT